MSSMTLSESVFCRSFVVRPLRSSRHTTALDLGEPNYGGQISHAHQIVGGAGKSKNPVHFAHSAMAHLAQKRDGLQPAKAFLDPLSLILTDGILRMPGGAPINGTPAASLKILRHVRSNSHMA